jgi:putative pyruvate formate lyase activating enzyme
MAYRAEGRKGYCLSDLKIKVARAALHMWEEPCISGKQGSGAVFFSGCSLRCVYCQNHEIAQGYGREVSVHRLAEIFLSLQAQGAANINLVTPDHYILAIIQAVRQAREMGLGLPVVYNCSGYAKAEAIESLKGTVDIFLTDFKYMEEETADRYSKAPDYPLVAASALQAMVETVGEPVFDDQGMMKKGVIVRHLLLPGHKKNAKEVIRYVHETYHDRVILSLMNQYTPMEPVQTMEGCEKLRRRVTKREYDSIVDYALSLGVEKAFIQEGKTAEESFIPVFDCEGV